MGETRHQGQKKEPAKTKNRNMWKLYGTFQFDVRVSLNQTHFSFSFFAVPVPSGIVFSRCVETSRKEKNRKPKKKTPKQK